VVPAHIYTIPVHLTGNGALSMTTTVHLLRTTAAVAEENHLVSCQSSQTS